MVKTNQNTWVKNRVGRFIRVTVRLVDLASSETTLLKVPTNLRKKRCCGEFTPFMVLMEGVNRREWCRGKGG